jgi:hypothetical protein
LLLNSAKELSIFFTGNGILMGQSSLWLLILMICVKFTGKQIPINSTVTMDCLYPTVSMSICSGMVVEANFGGNTAEDVHVHEGKFFCINFMR